MANRTHEDVQASKPAVVIIAGRFVGGAASATTILEGAPDFTVVGSGSGLYTITFSHKYQRLLSFQMTLGAATPSAVGGFVPIRDDFATNDTLPVLVTNAAGTGVDLAALQYLDFVAVFQDTTA